MVNGLYKDKPQWYVMRAYKNESTAEERLSDEKYGLTHFIPKEKESPSHHQRQESHLHGTGHP